MQLLYPVDLNLNYEELLLLHLDFV